MIVVFRALNLETLISKLAQLGPPTRPAVDEDGNSVPVEYRIGQCTTPTLTDVRGNLACCVMLTDEQAALIPDVTAPDFLCDWRSDETETVIEVTEDGEQEVERQLPWPEYEISYQLEDGTTVTTLQGCGRFAE